VNIPLTCRSPILFQRSSLPIPPSRTDVDAPFSDKTPACCCTICVVLGFCICFAVFTQAWIHFDIQFLKPFESQKHTHWKSIKYEDFWRLNLDCLVLEWRIGCFLLYKLCCQNRKKLFFFFLFCYVDFISILFSSVALSCVTEILYSDICNLQKE